MTTMNNYQHLQLLSFVHSQDSDLIIDRFLQPSLSPARKPLFSYPHSLSTESATHQGCKKVRTMRKIVSVFITERR